MARIVILQGHPDPSGERLCHALADAYAQGARTAGHDVKIVDIARIDFPLLRTQAEWQRGIDGTPDSLKPAQQACLAADHYMVIYPLWMGTMPALLKGFIEQVFRPGVALSYGDGYPKPMLKGKSARIVITMGMPALAYRWYFFAHSLKNLERNILGYSGVSPIRSTLYGMIEQASEAKRKGWLDEMRKLGSMAR